MNKIKLAILGCGRVSEHYKKILSSNAVNGFEVIGVCDLDLTKAKNHANHYNCKYFTSFEIMLKETKPSLVIILTPSGEHFEHALMSLKNGFNTLVEKPPAMLPDQIIELYELAKKNNLLISAAYQNRLNPAITCLKKAIEDKRFGKIVSSSIRLRWCRYNEYYSDNWHGRWSSDGGVINQQAIHHIDALCWLLGDINKVCSIGKKRLNSLEAEDTMVSIIEFTDGSLCTLEATTAARPIDFEASISVVAEKGMAQIGGIALNKIDQWHFSDEQIEDKDIPRKYSQEVENGYGLSHGPLLQNIINFLKTKKNYETIPIIETIKTCELVHALYKSNENEEWIFFDSKPLSSKLGVLNA